jgi:hypothetical protein
MALLRHVPDTATIMAMRGRVDVYEDRLHGWVARSWPKRRASPISEAEQPAIEAFTAYVQYAGASDPTVRAAWKEWMEGHGATWVDANRATASGKYWISSG